MEFILFSLFIIGIGVFFILFQRTPAGKRFFADNE
jgi:hypothetical protein